MLGLRTILATLALASCGKGDVVSEPAPIDAMAVKDGIAVKAVAAYAPLVGSWTGSVQLKSVGFATGMVSIDASGNGTFFASAAGASRSGTIEILSLANGQVRARALGQERSVAIVVGTDKLTLDVPGVGEVVLTRSQPD
tara:strand:- start:99 stop:518 length:420 start_codon:yes stop_codon:yes gene_type:complete